MSFECDAFSFLYLIDKGLRSIEDLGLGGCGGRSMHVPENEFNPEADYGPWLSIPTSFP